MSGVIEILQGYKKSIDDSIMDFIGYVVKNMDNLDLEEVKLRCEYISDRIDKYKGVHERARNVVKELKEVEGGKEAV